MNRLRTSIAGLPAHRTGLALPRELSGPARHLWPAPPKALAALICAAALALAAALAFSPAGAPAPGAPVPAGALSLPFSSSGPGLKGLSGLGVGGSAALSEPTAAQRAQAASAYGRLPLSFEQNRGQTDPRVRYMARGAGYQLFLTPQEAVLSLQGKGKDDRAAALRLGFEGANPNPAISGQSALPGRVNYLTSSDPARQQRNVPTFARANYRELWPGIGASFYGRRGQLEYDFELAPKADPNKIVMSFGGADSLRVGAGGDLKIGIGKKTVRQLAPVSYQLEGGRRQVVQSRYVLLSGKRVGIRLGAYDRSRPLVIDPVLAYSTYLGGGAFDSGNGIAADASGSAYVTGSTQSPNFPTTAGSFAPTRPGTGIDRGAFVTKLTPDGSALDYSTFLGERARANAIAVDGSGSAYVTGSSISSFPTTPNAFDRDADNGSEAFITKLIPDGSALAYSTFLGGRAVEDGQAIAVDGAGMAYVTGSTDLASFVGGDPEFPTTPGAFDESYNGGPFGGFGSDGFVAKLDPSKSGDASLVYSTYLGGGGNETGDGIAVDGSGNAYVTGQTDSGNFPTTPGASQETDPDEGLEDAFVTKLNSAGSALAYSTYLGGGDFDGGVGLAVDGSGSAYVTGETDSTDFPTENALDDQLGDCCDAFVTKLNSAGNDLVYSTYLGGEDGFDAPVLGPSLAIDDSGGAYVTGVTESGDFPKTDDAADTTLGECAAYLTRVNPAGSALSYSTLLGGEGCDEGYSVAFAAGSAFVTGFAVSAEEFPIKNAFDPTYNGAGDGFVARIAFSPTAITGPATRVGQTQATVTGTVNPSGSPTTFRFEYGPTTAYGQTTAPQSAGSGSSDQEVSAVLAGLVPGTTYNYRLVATNEFGTTTGANRTLRTTSPAPPQASQCADGRDNDRDGQADFPRDPGCGSRQDNSEADRCTIIRGPGNDVIRGTPGNDVICAGAGNDVVYGGGGNDAILGQGGNDALRGQAGNDSLSGGPGNDRLWGGPGNDRLSGGPGNDSLTGSSGGDSLVGGPGNDSANGGPGNDSCPADRRDSGRSC